MVCFIPIQIKIITDVIEGMQEYRRVELYFINLSNSWHMLMMKDARKLGESNWRNVARNRDSWQRLLKKALDQKGAVVPVMMMMKL